jgi:hypothetical protein
VLKKTITYEDFNGDEVVEDFFFHLSKAELVELEMSAEGGLSESLQKIIASEDGKAIIKEFKNIILSSYGKRSDDGKRFKKSQELRDEFESSEAYSVLFMELVTDTDAAVEFINGIVPAGMAEEAAKLAAGTKEPETPALTEVPAPQPQMSQAEFSALSEEQRLVVVSKIAAGEMKITP